MSSRRVGTMIVAGTVGVALLCHAQKSEPIPPDMMGSPGTIVGFVRDTACLLRNKSASVAKDAESRKCIVQCVRAGSPLAILTKSGELYMPLSAQLPDRDQRRRLLPTQVSMYEQRDDCSSAVEPTQSVSKKSKSYRVGENHSAG